MDGRQMRIKAIVLYAALLFAAAPFPAALGDDLPQAVAGKMLRNILHEANKYVPGTDPNDPGPCGAMRDADDYGNLIADAGALKGLSNAIFSQRTERPLLWRVLSFDANKFSFSPYAKPFLPRFIQVKIAEGQVCAIAAFNAAMNRRDDLLNEILLSSDFRDFQDARTCPGIEEKQSQLDLLSMQGYVRLLTEIGLREGLCALTDITEEQAAFMDGYWRCLVENDFDRCRVPPALQ